LDETNFYFFGSNIRGKISFSQLNLVVLRGLGEGLPLGNEAAQRDVGVHGAAPLGHATHPQLNKNFKNMLKNINKNKTKGRSARLIKTRGQNLFVCHADDIRFQFL
jgi:hypothetical protein